LRKTHCREIARKSWQVNLYYKTGNYAGLAAEMAQGDCGIFVVPFVLIAI